MADDVQLVVATPCFGGQVSSIYTASLFKLQIALRSYSDIKLKLEMQQNDALITRARANLVSAFLDDPAATHLLFIDADIGFEPEQVLRLLACGADVCAGVYPIKRIDWETPTGRGLRRLGERSEPSRSWVRGLMPAALELRSESPSTPPRHRRAPWRLRRWRPAPASARPRRRA